MSKNMFAAKLAAGTRKAKKITTKSSASTSKVEKIISKVIPVCRQIKLDQGCLN
jgi:hypothetical protein